MFSSPTPYKNQRYNVLKRECQEQKKLFEDTEFPCNNSSLFFSNPLPRRVEWRRPGEISENPHLIVKGISSHDLNQGEVGNCWFVAACSCLALKPELWQKVIPNWMEQEWDPKHPDLYAGIFRFHFWIFGEWTEVVVDDRLPTINSKLIYCHSKSYNEFWSALLEKAYAKLTGCYESLSGGNTGDAVVDFSGAVNEPLSLRKGNYQTDPKAKEKLFFNLLEVYEHGGIISCSIAASSRERELRLANGLVKGHAYSVTAVKMVHLGHGNIPLIRMRNPWGKHEWNGAWSDSSEEWQKIGAVERNNLGITVKDDGEFWMSFDDWCQNFTEADVCRLINTSMLSVQETWNEVMHFGNWTRHLNPLKNRCGGCINHKLTFLQNPQYVLDISQDEGKLLVSLQQRDMKIHRCIGAGENLFIGFSIFKVELNRKYRMHDIITQQNVATSKYINARSVVMRGVLSKGLYVIIPTTFSPGTQGEFMLRVYTDQDAKCSELDLDKPQMSCWSCWSWFRGYPQLVTQVYIYGAEGLENQDRSGGVDPYVIVSCENISVQSEVQKDTREPRFDTRAVFYRKKESNPITIQVWNHNTVKDQFLGQVVLPATVNDSTEPQKLKLRRGTSQTSEELPGSISLQVVTSSELTAI